MTTQTTPVPMDLTQTQLTIILDALYDRERNLHGRMRAEEARISAGRASARPLRPLRGAVDPELAMIKQQLDDTAELRHQIQQHPSVY